MSSLKDFANHCVEASGLRERLAMREGTGTFDATCNEDIDMTAPESPKKTTEIARPVTVEESNLIRAQVVETTQQLERTVKRVDQAVEQVERTAGQVQQTTMKVANHTELLEDNDSMINSCGNDLFHLQEQVRCNEEVFERYKKKADKRFQEIKLLSMELYAIVIDMDYLLKGKGSEERVRGFLARIARFQEQAEAIEEAEANGDVDDMVDDAADGVQRMGM